MTKTSLRVLSVLSVLGLAIQAQAFTAPTPTPAQSSTTPQYIVPGQGGNAAEAGRSSSSMQYLTAGVNGAAAAMYGAKCGSKNYWACAMSAISAVGAVQSLQSARGSNTAGMQLAGFDPSLYGGGMPGGSGGTDQWGNPIDTGVGGVGDTGGTGATGAGGTGIGLGSTIPQVVARDIAQAKNALDRSGVKISPDGKTMTTPDGRKFDLSRGAGSSDDLLAMGLTQAEANLAMADGRAIAKKANEKYKQMAQLPGAGGGGGGGRAVAAEGGGDPFAGFDPFARERAARNRKKAKVSGLTKKLGSDNIGVAGDDIFEMVTRRYKARDEQNAFLKD